MPVRLVSQEELPAPLLGYKLIERLGRGGFGEVWKVEAPGGLHKAAKFVFGDLDAMDEDSRPAEQELKAMKRVREIRHPYILSLERYDQIEGQLIIIMELADRNLWDRFRECRAQGLPGVPREELLGYMSEAAEALDLMNSQYQIQHLDIKPQNLFLVHNHIKVADFGLAKVLEGVRAAVTGGVTPVYAAPETFEGWVSRFSDQYSLAIVFQELLTGNRPFNGTNTRQLLMQHMNGTPDLSGLSESDAAIIGRGLSKKPDDRYPSCGDLVRALKLSGSPLAQLIASQREPMPPAPSQFRPTGRASSPTVAEMALDPAAPGPPSSVQITRLAPGGPGRLGDAPPQAKNNETPQPGRLPPLVQARPPGTPLPTAGFGARLVTPSAASAGGSNPAMTLQRPVIFQTGRMGSLGIAPPEKTGDGVLFPALVLAIGQTGKRVAEALKKLICDRHLNTDKVPNVRFLYIDTDPEAVPTNPPDHPGGLAPHEAVLARLNRPGHYLQRDSLPPVDPWMPSGALYKLPRNPAAAEGVRAFGRLALFDHYRLIAQRVRQEIEAFMIEGPVNEAHKNTRLGLRTNRPRAYLVAGLAGGTGSGMFLDVAFLLRHEMRQVGYFRPEINGVFFAPPASKAGRGAALGNAYAALAELHHYQAKKGVYQTTFDKAEPPVVDSEPPFTRVAVLPLSKAATPRTQAAAAGLAARVLFNEVLTPVGRVADEGRDKLARAVPAPGPTCETFGLFRLSWPRPEMLAAATCRFAQRQIQRWTAKDAAHLHEPIATWLAQQWTERQFDLETMAEEFRAAVQETLREDPDRVVDAIVNPLRTNTPSGGKFDAVAACTVLDELLKLVGKPDAAEDGAAPGLVVAPLAARHERLVKDAEGHIGMMAATFIEVPQFRLPAAEEAVRQITARLKTQVEALAPVRDLLEKDVRALWTKLVTAIGALNAGRASRAAEIVELFSEYPRKRLKLHVADNCLALYRKLLGSAPEYLREINFCRGSLGEMHAHLAAAAPQSTAPVGGKLILPPGCSTLDEAADQFLAGLAPEELLTFEQGLQKEVKRKLKSVGSVCLHPNDKGPIFREILLRMSREFLDKHLDHADPAMVFFRYRSEGDAEALLAEAYEGAAPELGAKGGPGGHYETFVLGVPPGPAGDELRDLTANALPGIDIAPAVLPDDICFYRELSLVPLAGLPQLGEYGREAYQAMATGDHPPHARIDIPWQPPA